jgi:hypothetical protein
MIDLNANDMTAKVIADYARDNGDIFLRFGSESQIINKSSFEKFYKSIRPNLYKSPLISVTFSGHHGADVFSGIQGELSRDDFLSIIASHNDFHPSVKKLILRGCYTTTIENILPSSPWFKIFPEVDIVAGFEKKAWDDSKPASYDFIKAIIDVSPEHELESIKQVEKFFKNIPFQAQSELAIWVSSDMQLGGNAGIYLSTSNIQNNKRVLNLNTIVSSCSRLHKKKRKYEGLIDEILLDKNTLMAENQDDLRDIYEFLVVNHHCFYFDDLWAEDKKSLGSMLDHPDSKKRIMYILFFENLIKNFANYLNRIVGVHWYLNWRNYLSSQQFVAVPSIVSDSVSITSLDYIDIQKIIPDIQSIIVNNNSDDKNINIINEVFYEVFIKKNYGVMPQSWMTLDSSSTDVPIYHIPISI